AETPENLETIRKFWPVGFFKTLEPSPSSPGVLEKASFFAYPQIIFTHAGVDDEAVYKLTKAVYESKDLMTQTFPTFAQFDPAEMARETGASQYHPGAIRFFKEVGIWKE